MYTLADFKVGDFVRPIAWRPDDYEDSPSWIGDMDRYRGELGQVTINGNNVEFVRVRFQSTGRYGEVSYEYKPSWLVPEQNMRHEVVKIKSKFTNFNEYMEHKTKAA